MKADEPGIKTAAPAGESSSGLKLWLRRMLWRLGRVLTRLLYRIRVDGAENIPATGGALLVCNHLSMVDAPILATASPRYIRFLMYRRNAQKPLIRPFARLMGIIPIASDQSPRELIQSLRAAGDAIRRGELVCIFAEGQVTRIGQMLPFRRGFEVILKHVQAPVIPVCLDGLWGSLFSFERGRLFWKWPKRVPYPVSVSFGQPMSSELSPSAVRVAVQDLGSHAWRHRKATMETLHRAFVRTARRHPFRFAMGDQRAPRLTFLNALARTIYLARRLKSHWAGQDKVGLLLPPSVAGALVNFAALLMGKVPVNLNYTASADTIASCVRQAGVKTILSSQAFLDKLKLTLPIPPLLLERIADRPRLTERLTALLLSGLLPARWLERFLGCQRPVGIDDLATLIFSSGSTGEAKGVMLTHYNIASNLAQLEQVLRLTRRDRFLGTLPFFHSFGFTGTLCMIGFLGSGVVYHPTPLDADAVGSLTRQHAATVLLTTPTFLQLYLRGCSPDEFGSLRMVIAGAEKLPESLATAFEDKFGIRPLEGYGCTECAPVVAINTHDFRSAGLRQAGARRGKVGHPLPGMSVRILDPSTEAPLPIGQPGMLWVRGPNIMPGYLGQPDKTAAVLRDGWYVTGDIVSLDEDGFLQITDRLSRFSKIGGEMVPHIKVEEKLQSSAGALDRVLVVTGINDDRKGERLVVLHCLNDVQLQDLLTRLPQLDLPKLWIPKAKQFFRVAGLPLLGSGKLDLCQVRQLAIQFSRDAETREQDRSLTT